MQRRGEYFHLVETQQSNDEEEIPKDELDLAKENENPVSLPAGKEDLTDTKGLDISSDAPDTVEHTSLMAMARFVLSLDSQERKWILFGLLSLIIAGACIGHAFR